IFRDRFHAHLSLKFAPMSRPPRLPCLPTPILKETTHEKAHLGLHSVGTHKHECGQHTSTPHLLPGASSARSASQLPDLLGNGPDGVRQVSDLLADARRPGSAGFPYLRRVPGAKRSEWPHLHSPVF